MKFLYLLEKVRIPVLNEIMLVITELGGEMTFLVLALILVWCVDKKSGYYVLSVGFIGTIVGQFMKLWFRIPRPWVLDGEFTILEEAREAAAGYSFPSGHTLSSVGTFGSIAHITKNRVLRVICIIISVLVPFSRMYVGVHTPLDVCVGAAIAVVLILVLKPIILRDDDRVFPAFLGVMITIAIGYLLFVTYYPFPVDIDPHNMHSGLKNAYTMLGSITGLTVVYFVDTAWLHFPTGAVWWAQIIKVAAGLGIALGVKNSLRAPLEFLFGELPGRGVRYFLLVIVAGVLWPLTFPWFAKLGKREEQ